MAKDFLKQKWTKYGKFSSSSQSDKCSDFSRVSGICRSKSYILLVSSLRFFVRNSSDGFSENGKFHMSFHNFSSEKSQSFGGVFLKIQENKIIQYEDSFDDPNLPGKILTTVSFTETLGMTEITVKQENIPEMIPAAMCYLGWQECLEKLIKLVTPTIPD